MLSAVRFRLSSSARRFAQARSGVAATEFALIMPLMIVIWVGMVVATDSLNADRKVTVLTRTLTDLTTQYTAVAQTDLDTVFGATSAILWPAQPKDLGMKLTSIDIDGAGVAWVDWSGVPSDSNLRGSYAATPRCTKVTDLPAGLKVARTSVILAETSMIYQASIATQLVDELFGGAFQGGKVGLGDKLYMRPRQVTKVTFSPPPSGNCAGYVP